jgi:hypothetical protein
MANSSTQIPALTRALRNPIQIFIHTNFLLFIIIFGVLSLPVLFAGETYIRPTLIEQAIPAQQVQNTAQTQGTSNELKWSKVYHKDAEDAPIRTFIEFKKINDNGQVDWTRTVGYDQDSRITYAQQLRDKGYIAIGSTGSRYGSSILVIKLTQDGSIPWFKTEGEGLYANAISVIEAENGNIIVVGNIQGFEGESTKIRFELDPYGVLLSNSTG